ARRRTKGRAYALPFPEDGLPPEKLVDDDNDTPASDVYGAGLLLYELLCNARPFRRRSSNETVQAILRDAPAAPSSLLPDVSEPLSALALSMLAKSPKDRPANGAALVASFSAMLPRAPGWRGLLGSNAKPSDIVAAMLRERAKELLGPA